MRVTIIRRKAAHPAGRKTLRVAIPKTRDPFINVPLLPLGPDENGAERFWTSTCNSVVGCLAVVVNEFGEHRVYHFKRQSLFYSAIQEDQDTLWLCGFLDRVVRLRLRSGKWQVFRTGLPDALVFTGMVYDKETGKLFASAYPGNENTAFSFDVRARKTARIHTDFCKAHYMRFSFPNGDGTYTIVFQTLGMDFVRWDPRTEKVETLRIQETVDQEISHEGDLTYRMISDECGRWYVPRHGWYDPMAKSFDKSGPTPEKEMTWFARRGSVAYGSGASVGDVEFGRWDMTTGKVEHLCTLPEGHFLNTRLTGSGKLVCVNHYGYFFRVDAETGALECSKRLPTDSYGHVDCLVRIDKDRLLGTPFITQRFWEANIRTGEGLDCGKAAPGNGEVLETWRIGGKVYMAAYTGGELVEYDPQMHPHFPENPRVVADPPNGMRPVAAAHDGLHIFYSCSAPYGFCGSVLTKYDTRTGLATYRDTPLPSQQIQSMFYDRKTDTLLCAATIFSDCGSCEPVAERASFASIRADDLSLVESFACPKGIHSALIHGRLSRQEWLCGVSGALEDGRSGTFFFTLSDGDFRTPKLEELRVSPAGFQSIAYTERPGLFVCRVDYRTELWDMQHEKRVAVLWRRDPAVYRALPLDDSVYIVRTKEIVILEDALKQIK